MLISSDFLPLEKTKTLFGEKDIDPKYGLKVYPRRFIGAGSQGTVVIGRLKFKGRHSRQVAVKIFDRDEGLEKGMRLRNLQNIITDFAREGVSTLRFGVLEHEGKKVLVSNLFSKRKPGDESPSSKLTEMADARLPNAYFREQPEVTLFIAKQLALMLRAGWMTNDYRGVFHIYPTSRKNKAIVGEVDPFHYYRIPHGNLEKALNEVKFFLEQLQSWSPLYAKAFKTVYSHMPESYRKPFLGIHAALVHPEKKITVGEITRKKTVQEREEIAQAWHAKLTRRR